MLLPNKKYDIIYADPPWRYKGFSSKGEGKNANQHYDCMSIEDICKLPVKNISKDNCILFRWVTDPLLEKAFDVIEAWGFIYKTVAFTWAKYNISGCVSSKQCYYSQSLEKCLRTACRSPLCSNDRAVLDEYVR